MSFDLFIECIRLWWDPEYSTWMFFALFLPAVILIYSVVKREHRYMVLLISSWFFFITISGWLFLIHLFETVLTWKTGLLLQGISDDDSLKRKEKAAKKKKLLSSVVVFLILILFLLKYLDFTGSSIIMLINSIGIHAAEWKMLNLAVPVGISYFTLEAISYITDIYWDKIRAEEAYTKVALYMGFFPTLTEGPITRFSDVNGTLFSGIPVSYENLTSGYQRILLGLFKKLMIADHLAPAVDIIYKL
ncbi:MAG: hypothetical protein K5668_07760, partial [Lachnospiraceae bacterium]|nr:hypothetical protein [Lachnospiraceae bacterium]